MKAKRRSLGAPISATLPLAELHKLQARRLSATLKPPRAGSRLSRILELEKEKAIRSKSVAFKLSRRLVEKDEIKIKDAADKLRDSLQGHAFVRDILGQRDAQEEGEDPS